jgi:hypothetical protein
MQRLDDMEVPITCRPVVRRYHGDSVHFRGQCIPGTEVCREEEKRTMKFSVYESPRTKKRTSVKQGFSWPGFLFTPVRAYANGLWVRRSIGGVSHR